MSTVSGEPDPGDPGLAAAVTPAPAPAPVPVPPGDPGLAAERDRLARTLRDTRLQLAMTQARLSALERSASLELGRTLARAARHPWSQGVQLPLNLIRMWRERGSLTGPAAAALALASARLDDLTGVGERFLSALTAPGLGAPGAASAGFTPPGIVVTGVLTARACATLAPDAAVYPLLPHDADVILESTGADVVLIEAAAMLAGSAWAYAGDPAAADRGRRLGRVIAAARALGKPVIFIRNIPAYLAPGLDWVAASCDAVSDEGFGVQLARFNPVGLPAYRPCDPVYAGGRDPREPPALRALLDSVAGSVQLTGEISWRRRPGLYRDHGLFVSASADQAREQLACGARVIMITGERVAGALACPDGGCTPAALRKLVASVRAEPPLDGAEVLPVLREIFAEHATPARLAALARLGGLPDRMVAGRQIAILARVEDAAAASALSASLRGQRMMPAEVVVAVGAPDEEAATQSCRAVTAALGGLADLGVTITVIPGTPAGQDAARAPGTAAWAADAAKQARSPWVAPWVAPGGAPGQAGAQDREYGEFYLLDLACARECTGADGVGYAGLAYAYVTSLEPALARREFFGSDGSDRGLRFFSLS
jgi:hypothetical protein